ncbi:hypothetical protein [Kitasatospora sp. NPDC085879]|uniref:hypothetical protein n=1 Tax=Kitasatospora sp. NPDC085879 TaxID=3154769 RepID=UPI00342A4857
MSTKNRRTRVLAAALLALALTGCGSAASGDGMSGMHHGSDGHTHSHATASGSAHAGADHTSAGDGLGAEQGGYRLDLAVAQLPAGAPAELRFGVTGPDGARLTAFRPEQTKPMHFYAIRSDLTGFQHLHPTMAADGTWTAPLAALPPGSWRVYASFVPDAGAGAGTDLVLSRPLTVPGTAADTPLPPAAATAAVDGYTLTVSGALTAGTAAELKVTVSRDGRPVTDLQPYLGTFAHLTAFHAGDQAFAHLHPQAAEGAAGGPELTFHAELPKPGDWRLHLQFQTGGTLHTAALTLHAA